MIKIPSDGGEGAGDGGRPAPGVGLNPKPVAFNPPRRTCGHEALSKPHLLQGSGFLRECPLACFSSPRRMKMAGVATASASCEPWVFRGSKKPTLHANIAVSVATKARLFMKVSILAFITMDQSKKGKNHDVPNKPSFKPSSVYRQQ